MPEVHVIGELKGAFDLPHDKVFAKWQFEFDSRNWRVVDGESAGRTWTAARPQSDQVAPWNHPIDVTFVCSGLKGWPKLFLEVFSLDSYNREDLCGYGFCNVPASPGTHLLQVPLYQPSGSTSEWLRGLCSRLPFASY